LNRASPPPKKIKNAMQKFAPSVFLLC